MSEISDEKSNTQSILHKVDVIMLNNSWNDKNEKIIISIGENSASYKWMHERCSSFHKTIYKCTSILLIILSTGLTIGTILNNSGDYYILNILSQVMTYLITTISVLQSFLKSQETSEKHLTAANDFSKLYHDIQQQMCMFRRDRVNATKYVSDCLKLYDSLIINNPDINTNIITKFKKTFKNSDISLPDIADKIQKIEIITEPSFHNKIEDLTKEIHEEESIETKKISFSKKNCSPNLNNLASIHNAFQIHGDLSDKDLENINSTEFRQIKNKILRDKSNYNNYEYERFLQHSSEKD
jgi:hypothetical protein